MADGNDRSNSRLNNQGYTMHPYYYQQYYGSVVPGAGYGSMVGQPQMYQIADPSQPGGYRWVYPAAAYQNMAMMQQQGYYFPYQHPAYMQQMPVPAVPVLSNPPESAPVEAVSEPAPAAPSLARKTSKGFPKDKSKWRLSRSGSRLDMSEEELPSSPNQRPGYSVSPRNCGSEFLPDEKLAPSPPSFSKKGRIHLVDAVRIASGELGAPTDQPDLMVRLGQLDEILNLEIPLVLSEDSLQVIGLDNPVNSKICYLNSVLQILLPISPLVQVLSLSLSHISSDEMLWTQTIARCFRLMFHPPMGVPASVLEVPGCEKVIEELGGIGTQQDVGEALSRVLDRLHEDWKYDSEHNSFIYKLFRGMKCFPNGKEMFTSIHLAPGNTCCDLNNLLALSFTPSAGLIHYLPPVLCVELSRHLSENQLTTSQTSIPFSGTLDVPESCCTPECNKRNKYQLVGAVMRSGVYANSGHFWAAQRRGNQWYIINDTDVSTCQVSEAEQLDKKECLISKTLKAASNWCVLVYADIEAAISLRP